MRRLLLATCLLLMVANCGSDELTLTEYAEQVEIHTTTMHARLAEFNEEGAFDGASVARIQTIFARVAEVYGGLFDGLRAIEPPSEIAEVHDAAIAMASRLKAASDGMALRAEAVEALDQMDALFDSPEAKALEVATAGMIGFCLERQAEFDATADREVFADTAWIPAEMQEVVLVAFGCESLDGGDS